MHGAPLIRFPEALRLRCPRGLPAAVEAVARKHHTSGPEWVRQTLLRAVEAEGVCLRRDGQIEIRDAARAAMSLAPNGTEHVK